jgi:hypothetical protein
MWPIGLVLASFVAILGLPLFAHATESSTVDMWECPGPDGTILYTNKERADCRPKALQALSVVPSMQDMPFRPSNAGGNLQPGPGRPDYSYDTPMGALRNLTQVPDFARDWYAGNVGGGSVQAEVCGMYMEWLHLAQNSRGFFFGTDPSYGGNPTARNWFTPSYSFYDNARYVALSRIFGAGFVPIGCH